MSRIVRKIAACMTVALLAALQLYGALDTQHRVEHSMQYPGVAYVSTVAEPHHHDEDGHDFEATPSTEVTEESIEAAEGGETPLKHHHHGGGDLQLALVTPSRATNALSANVIDLGPTPDALPPGALRDAPYHPPKLRA